MKSIHEFLSSMKQFLIEHGMDPEDEGLVEAYSILFQRGGGMGWHPDAAKKDYPHLHFVRFVLVEAALAPLTLSQSSLRLEMIKQPREIQIINR